MDKNGVEGAEHMKEQSICGAATGVLGNWRVWDLGV
jgi:hypothetical protein